MVHGNGVVCCYALIPHGKRGTRPDTIVKRLDNVPSRSLRCKPACVALGPSLSTDCYLLL